MTHPTSGDEPSLSGQSEFTGREPALGGVTGGGLTAALDGLTSRDWQVRVRSVKYLDDHGVGAAADRVVALLRDPNGQVRDAALNALIHIGEPAVPALLIALAASAESKVIRTLMRALQGIQLPAVPYLLDALQGDSTPFSAQIIRVLGGIEHEDAISALIRMLAHEDRKLQYAAVSALRQQRAAAIPALIEALRHSHNEVRSWAAGLLGQHQHRPAIPALIEAVRDPVPDVRRAAIHALAQMGDDTPVEVILAALQDTDIRTRVSVVQSLGFVRRAETLAALSQIIQSDESRDIRREALEVLSETDQEYAIPVLVATARDDRQETRVRYFAVELLTYTYQLAPLIFILQDETLPEFVRGIAYEYLLDLSWLVIPVLAEYEHLANTAIAVRNAAHYLDHLQNGLPDMERGLIIETLRYHADPISVPALIEYLNDTALVWYYPFDGHGEGDLERITIAEIAARALTKIGTPDALAAVNRWRSGQRADDQ
jgi:HEAT repeat protein